MYKSEFDKEFSKGLNYNAYLFYGEDEYLVESYAINTAHHLADGEDITKIYFEEFKSDSAIDFLSQSSLFSPKNILLIKTAKKIPKKELDKLVESCDINRDSKLIIACFGDVDFKSMESSFSKKTNSVAVRFYKLRDYEAINFLSNEAKKVTLDIDIPALEFLYNMHQKNLGLCISDLGKLALLNEPISSKTISHHCFGLGNVNMEDFLEKLFTKQAINKDLYDLLEEGINEVQLVTRITQFAQTLFMINSYLKLNGELNILEIWGYKLPNQIAQKYASIAMGFKQDDFKEMLTYLIELELELKSGKIPDINAYTQAKLRKFLRS